MNIETTDAQNTIARIRKQLYLNVERPTQPMKKQYAKVERELIHLEYALDVLNDIKDANTEAAKKKHT